MKKFDIIPNYYAYTLKLNGRKLSAAQTKTFFNCVNKINRNNDKFVYRGDNKTKLSIVYGINKANFNDNFRDAIFVLGAKANMFFNTHLPGMNTIDIAHAGGNEFRLLFQMLSRLLNKEFPFSTVRNAINRFRRDEVNISAFFRNEANETFFVDTISSLPFSQKIIVRDYYLALLHHISKSEYYNSSFLLSTTIDFLQANKFAYRKESEDSNDAIILFGWIPKNYNGVLNVPDTRILKSKIDFHTFALPIYEMGFFPYQKEVTLKGGLLPHYMLGYLHNTNGEKVFEINPALLKTDDSWNGVELPIDQGSFQERIQQTAFGRYFSLDTNNQYNQYENRNG